MESKSIVIVILCLLATVVVISDDYKTVKELDCRCPSLEDVALASDMQQRACVVAMKRADDTLAMCLQRLRECQQ